MKVREFVTDTKIKFPQQEKYCKFIMPFWKRGSLKKTDSADSGSAGVNGDAGKPKEKVDYKARLQHKQYLVSST